MTEITVRTVKSEYECDSEMSILTSDSHISDWIRIFRTMLTYRQYHADNIKELFTRRELNIPKLEFKVIDTLKRLKVPKYEDIAYILIDEIEASLDCVDSIIEEVDLEDTF